jgi:hypothetical protein
MSAGHLLPVSGTPHANATCLTPGIAATRSRACAWNAFHFSRCIMVTVMARMFSVSYPGRTRSRFRAVRIRSAAPASSAKVSAIWNVATAPSQRRSARPAVLRVPLAICNRSGNEARKAGNTPATTAASSAATNPKTNTRHPTVTASDRGTAWLPIVLNMAMMPAAIAAPARPLTSANATLSVIT